jgi:HSP20 family molecular chaperone IbpA
MSLIPHQYFPRSIFDTSDWFNRALEPTLHAPLSSLDVFDPFNRSDYDLSRDLPWLTKPSFLADDALFEHVPHKYRVSVDCSGFSPDSVKCEVKDKHKLVVTAKEKCKKGEKGDYELREFQKTYILPNNAMPDKLASWMAGKNLICEIPLKEPEALANVGSQLFPKVIDNQDGTKTATMRFAIPENVDPSKVHISVKDRDLIFRCEENIKNPDGYSKFHYYQKTQLPENAQIDQLKCVRDGNHITATAPLSSQPAIPVAAQKQHQQIKA